MAVINANRTMVLRMYGESSFVYRDKNTSGNANDIKIDVDNLSTLSGKVINVLPATGKETSPLTCGRLYLLNKNETVHGQSAGFPIAVINPDTGAYVSGDTSHYNPYFVPMNNKEVMRLLIQVDFAIWLNPPFYYAIDADDYLGKNLIPYDDPDWKCKIIRGDGWATVQGVCRVDAKKAIKPATAGERDIIGAGLPFRPMTHTQVKCCSKFTTTSGVADDWLCQVDYSDGGIWVKSGSTLTGTDDFCINVTFPVWSRKE